VCDVCFCFLVLRVAYCPQSLAVLVIACLPNIVITQHSNNNHSATCIAAESARAKLKRLWDTCDIDDYHDLECALVCSERQKRT
jgi:hypothetical protein